MACINPNDPDFQRILKQVGGNPLLAAIEFRELYPFLVDEEDEEDIEKESQKNLTQIPKNELDENYWRNVYTQKQLTNIEEFQSSKIPGIENKFKPDSENVYHGTNTYKIDSDGNLVLTPSKNFNNKTTSISLTQVPVVAQDYMLRKKGNIIIKIKNKALGNNYTIESPEEIAINGNQLFIVPKDQYEIIKVSTLSETMKERYANEVEMRSEKLKQRAKSDLDLIDAIYSERINADNFSELEAYGDVDISEQAPDWYVPDEYLDSRAAEKVYQNIKNKINKSWVINNLSNSLIDIIKNTGKAISDIEYSLNYISTYGDRYSPYSSNLFKELLQEIGINEKTKEYSNLVKEIKKIVTEKTNESIAFYNSPEQVKLRKEEEERRKNATTEFDFETYTPFSFSDFKKQLNQKAEVKPGVEEVFDSNPELASIGTPQQYSQYLDTIFPNSKVKDIVYHGTDAQFDKFKPTKPKFDTLNSIEGVYNFTTNKEFSKKYGKNILPVLLNISKPIQEKTSGEFIDDMDRPLSEALYKIGKQTSQNILAPKYDESLKDTDAVINRIEGDNYAIPIQTVISVFEPEQIHILGSKQDIEGFKDFVKNRSFDQVELDPELSNYLAEQISQAFNVPIPTMEKDTLITADEIDAFNRDVENRDGALPKEYFTGVDDVNKWSLNQSNLYDLVDKDTGEIYLRDVNLSTGMMEKKETTPEPVPEKERQEAIDYINNSVKEFRLDEILAERGYDVNDIISNLASAENKEEFNKIINKLLRLLC